MYETDVWVNFRDGLLSVYSDEYSVEDILCAYAYVEDKFFKILEELNKEI